MIDRGEAGAQVRPVGAIVPSPGQTLWTVQVLRGLAALMIVIGHSQSAVQGIVEEAGGAFDRLRIVPWGASVDLFFVISGFIIVHASRRLFGTPHARTEFLRRRLIRIVPLYWLVTTVMLAILAAAALKGGDRFPSGGAIAASYAFLPFDTYRDGRLFPVADLGWTLNYEMLFYVLLTLAVAWPPRRALTIAAILIALLAVVGSVVSGPGAAWFWTRPIVLDFGLGMAVAAMTIRVALRGRTRVVLALAAAALLLADPAHVFDGPAGFTVANEWPRVIFAGIPFAAILAAAVLGAQPPMPRAALPFTHVGDASYSLYLLHPFALIVLGKLAQKLPAVATAPGWLLVVCTVVAAIALALASYRWVEQPMTATLGRRLRLRPVQRPALAAE